MDLATGARVSELGALLRDDESVLFSGDGVTLYPNPNFLAKNENPLFRRDPIFISRLWAEDGVPHPLCPVQALSFYLTETASTKSFKVFVSHSDLTDLSLPKIRLMLCQFIRLADPGSIPKSHDLRKVASSFAFLRSMSLSDICGVTGWASGRVFRKHYLHSIRQISSSFVALGTKVSKSRGSETV